MLGRLSSIDMGRDFFRDDLFRMALREQTAVVKTLQIAGLIFGVAGLIYLSMPRVWGAAVAASLVISGIGLLFFSLFSSAKKQASASESIFVKPLSLADLAALLADRTEIALRGLSYVDVLSRFDDVLCPKQTVISFAGHLLHANQVGGEGISTRLFIASEAPLPEKYEIFWRIVFTSQPIIFDLTKRGEVYSDDLPYYPVDLHETVGFGGILVTLEEIEGFVSTYRVTDHQETKWIKRCHYASWPDHGVVSLDALLSLVAEVEGLFFDVNDLLWVHCHAGVGRTGCLITALILKEKILSGEITLHHLDEDLVDLVVLLRRQRGDLFVQTAEQLDLLRRFAYSLLKQ